MTLEKIDQQGKPDQKFLIGTIVRSLKCFPRNKQKLFNSFSLSHGSLTVSKPIAYYLREKLH
jgi:hypothetical protein